MLVAIYFTCPNKFKRKRNKVGVVISVSEKGPIYVSANIFLDKIYISAKYISQQNKVGVVISVSEKGAIYFSVCCRAINCHMTKTSRTQLK